ncbi:hypothetical protein DCO58_03455 [Helicobacter saguini]|uniref:Uncharacterized protein n=1 Tax=Helicobacter saguini TaxID=1548018 RepID=A0A6B0HKG3_9HELI|nr:hypothetical protein [Helicobacter saguini]MWV62572.1 hypothetical protein [Helicobacter saguini]MWV66754.1 hypothetical protein [Helicobacter saguini]MWV69105.1 hypothetical protein [Helicobacter saguini]MWV71340.1 hypothetical protein [Helicobacter saguini]
MLDLQRLEISQEIIKDLIASGNIDETFKTFAKNLLCNNFLKRANRQNIRRFYECL